MLSLRNKGEGNPMYGKKHNDETRKKLFGTAWKSGEKHHNWKGGGEHWWRRLVLQGDDWTCRRCGLREVITGFMEVDHIKAKKKFPELSREVSNGQTLCPNCHRRKTIENGDHLSVKAGRPRSKPA